MIKVSELQRDALGEIFNIGVERAAASLSQIVRDEIKLSAPTIQLVVPSEVKRVLTGREFDHLSTVSQEFAGPFDARAMLVLPKQNALLIVSQMLEGVVPPEQLGEFEQETMCEAGNIILNACISALADLFRVEFQGSLPIYENRQSLDLLGNICDEVPIILVVQIDLVIRQQSIQGHLMFLLSVSSLDELLRSINRYLETFGLE